MNPQQTPPSDPFTEPATTPSTPSESTHSSSSLVASPEKSHKRAVALLIVGLLLIIGAIGTYAYYMQANTPATDLLTKPTPSPIEKPSAVESTTEVLTEGMAEEDKLGETNDTTEINDADTAAGTVGESINENNL